MKQVYIGLLLFIPVYLFIASQQNVKKVDKYEELDLFTSYVTDEELEEFSREMSDFIPDEHKEEYIELRKKIIKKDLEENENIDSAYDRLSELEIIADKNIQKWASKKMTTAEKKVDVFKPLNVPFKRNPGVEVKTLSREELFNLMSSEGFKKLDGYSLGILRRIWLAYNYDQLFWDIHHKTNLPVSVIYSYFIIEATYQGVESKLMANFMNPGGIKYRGKGKKTRAYDDCYDRRGRRITCDFAVYENYDDMIEGWSNVFNQKRYERCKSYDTATEICRCLYKSGYHRANNWRNRADISREYWKLRLSFPQN